MRNSHHRKPFLLLASLFGIAIATVQAGTDQHQRWLNEPLDISPDFLDFRNETYLVDKLTGFDPASGEGRILWHRHMYARSNAFNNERAVRHSRAQEIFPGGVYPQHPELAFTIDFVSEDTVRLRMVSALNPPADAQWRDDADSLMLDGPVPVSDDWKYSAIDNGHEYRSPAGSVIIRSEPFSIELRNAEGELITRTRHPSQNPAYSVPADFSFIKRASDYSRSFSPAFWLSPGEMIFGLGENFQTFDKVGQKVVLSVTDPLGVNAAPMMYKPVPFYMSSRGYGMFMHTSTPITADFGATHDDSISLMIGDDLLDLFIFLGEPKEVLDSYTEITGKSPMPPLWSFGFWMSRITYWSEEQVRDVANKLREHQIPADVIHLDTGWFETDWQCDYRFALSRFDDPAQMIADLDEQGFKTSLWQLPYFVPQNRLFPEILEQNLHVRGENGGLPTEDAILDFSNPDAVEWYQEQLRPLLEMGVGAIKVDFGEAAPMNGFYDSGRTGFYEHNLYPLRYNKAAADITREVTGDNIIWARSAWAGSQRYPLHWGGDNASGDAGMAASLRGQLSLGLSGFAFSSHDIGGFTHGPADELYQRWLPFGMLLSHSRAHGQPPREPWEFGDPKTMEIFRKAANLRYRLMPYIYAQAKDSADHGLPVVRALFLEFPDDPGAWLVDDQYLLGEDLLVAPMLHRGEISRKVYLPGGADQDQRWVDYQTGKSYNAGWHTIKQGELPIVLLAREGAVIPHIGLAQHTSAMDWTQIELRVMGEADTGQVKLYLPDAEELQKVSVRQNAHEWVVSENPFGRQINFEFRELAKN